jgi:hypothetical protein
MPEREARPEGFIVIGATAGHLNREVQVRICWRRTRTQSDVDSRERSLFTKDASREEYRVQISTTLRGLFVRIRTLNAFPLPKILTRTFRLLVLIASDRVTILAPIDQAVACMPILVSSSTVRHFPTFVISRRRESTDRPFAARSAPRRCMAKSSSRCRCAGTAAW